MKQPKPILHGRDHAAGGADPIPEEDPTDTYRKISAASTNAATVKAAAGAVYGWFMSNQNSATRYVKLYNKASNPTVGTDTPQLTIAIPGGASANLLGKPGIDFTTGIAIAITAGDADANTGAVAADEIIVNLFYL